MKTVKYINDLGSLISTVEVLTEGNKIPLELNNSNEWLLKDSENINEYTFLINGKFDIPNLNNRFSLIKQKIISYAGAIRDQSMIRIDSLEICKQVLIDQNNAKAKFPSDKFSPVDNDVFIISKFSNVTIDLLLHVEIYTPTKLIGIIPAYIPVSNKSKNYQRTYMCAISTENFNGLNDTVTIRIKNSHEAFISKQFKFSSFQNYSFNQFKKTVYTGIQKQ